MAKLSETQVVRSLRQMKNKDSGEFKILIVKLGAIGDTVMSLSIVNAAKDRYPGAHITWMCGKTVEPILRCVTDIDRIIVIDDYALFRGGILQKISVICGANMGIAGQCFDAVLVPYRDKRYGLLTLLCVKRRYRSFSGNNRRDSFIPGRYHAIEYARLINEIDDDKIENVSLPEISLEHSRETDCIFDESTARYVALAPGGAKNLLNEDVLRVWPAENYRELAVRLAAQSFRVVLLGAQDDEHLNSIFTDLDVINLIGKTSLCQLLNVMKRISLLISHDTGIFHIGKLFAIPTIALFGPVNHSERVGKNENVRVIQGGESMACAPCYDGKRFADCKNNVCMKSISVEQVMNLAVDMLCE